MGIMDTRYPAYEVKSGHSGKIVNRLRRLEPDRKKGIVVRLESGFGLFGEVERIIRPKAYKCLKKGEYSMNVHWSAMRKYLKKYIERQ